MGMAIFYLSHALELDCKDWSLYFKRYGRKMTAKLAYPTGFISISTRRGVLLAELGHFESAAVDLKFAARQISQLRQSKEVNITATKEQQVLDHLGGVYNRMGIRAFKKGGVEEAAAMFTAALDCNPSVLTIYKNRAGKKQTESYLSFHFSTMHLNYVS